MVDNVCLHQARVDSVKREMSQHKGEQASSEATEPAAEEEEDKDQEAE